MQQFQVWDRRPGLQWPPNTASNATTCIAHILFVQESTRDYRQALQRFEGVSWIDVCWQTPERRHWLDTRQQASCNHWQNSSQPETRALKKKENRSKSMFSYLWAVHGNMDIFVYLRFNLYFGRYTFFNMFLTFSQYLYFLNIWFFEFLQYAASQAVRGNVGGCVITI